MIKKYSLYDIMVAVMRKGLLIDWGHVRSKKREKKEAEVGHDISSKLKCYNNGYNQKLLAQVRCGSFGDDK